MTASSSRWLIPYDAALQQELERIKEINASSSTPSASPTSHRHYAGVAAPPVLIETARNDAERYSTLTGARHTERLAQHLCDMSPWVTCRSGTCRTGSTSHHSRHKRIELCLCALKEERDRPSILSTDTERRCNSIKANGNSAAAGVKMPSDGEK